MNDFNDLINDLMQGVCENCEPQTSGTETEENHSISCEWCGGQIIQAAGCCRCITCGWHGCDG